MGLITVWESETDGKLFKEKQKYISHLRKLAAIKREQAKRITYRNERDAFFASMRATCKNTNELTAFIKENWERFYRNGIARDSHGVHRKAKGVPTLEWINLNSVNYSESVSISHRAPFGSMTNWGGRHKGPRGYPGWTLQLSYQTEGGCTNGCASEAWEQTGINTGTGGYGGNYYFSCEIFAHDWPAMYEEEMRLRWIANENRERQLAWQKVGGNPATIVPVTEVPEGWTPPALPELYLQEHHDAS
jgi:hypothetical protein